MSSFRQKKKDRPAQDRSLSAKAAVRGRDVLRSDCTLSMQRLCKSTWGFSEDKARQLGTDQVGYYLDCSMVVVLTPDDAYDLFVNHNYEKNRAFDQSHSANLSNAIKVAPAIDFAIGPNNFPVCVNGQHTLWAIYMRGQATQASITFYQCRNDESIAALFSIFDSNKKRTLANAIDAASMAVTSRHGRWVQCVAAAENGFHPPKSRETLSNKLLRAQRVDVLAFSEWLEGMITKPDQAKMIHQGIGAGFYAMWKSDISRATEFVKKYLCGLNMKDEHDPVKVVRDRMTVGKPHAEHGPTACRLHTGILFTAWRKFCLSQPLKAARATIDIPACDRWKIYESPVEATQ